MVFGTLNRRSDNEMDQAASASYANNYQGCLHERRDFLRRTSVASTAGFSLV